jgi:hypothetical protein
MGREEVGAEDHSRQISGLDGYNGDDFVWLCDASPCQYCYPVMAFDLSSR